jgi:hypothetical protein
MADPYDDERRREREREQASDYDRSGRDRLHERSATRRTTDEIRSWFGDEDAQRRRERDAMRHQADLQREERFERGNQDYYERERGGYDRGYGAPDPRREPSGRWDTGYGKDGGDYTDRTHGTDYPDGGYFDRERVPEINYGRGERQPSRTNPDSTRGYQPDRGSWRSDTGPISARETWSSRDDEYRRERGSSGWTAETGPHAGRGPRGYQRSDDRIREDICDRLTRHGRIDATDVNIAVNGGEVTLSGMVDTREAKRLAEDIAESVHGVRDVTNQIKVYHGDYGRQPRGDGAEEGGIGERGAPSVLGLGGSKEGTGTTLQSGPETNQPGRSEPGRNNR